MLEQLKGHSYFSIAAPKSTGREEFHLPWLESILENNANINSEDVQATLMRFSCETIMDAVLSSNAKLKYQPSVIYCCGGGAQNAFFLETLQTLCNNSNIRITNTDELGIGADWVEACAFAWLAKQRVEKHAISLQTVTGAKYDVIAGCIYSA